MTTGTISYYTHAFPQCQNFLVKKLKKEAKNLSCCDDMPDGVMSVEWSTSSEWVLYTGGCDGAIRFWDIRRAGCFRVLDNSQTQLGVRPPILKRPAVSSKVYS